MCSKLQELFFCLLKLYIIRLSTFNSLSFTLKINSSLNQESCSVVNWVNTITHLQNNIIFFCKHILTSKAHCFLSMRFIAIEWHLISVFNVGILLILKIYSSLCSTWSCSLIYYLLFGFAKRNPALLHPPLNPVIWKSRALILWGRLWLFCSPFIVYMSGLGFKQCFWQSSFKRLTDINKPFKHYLNARTVVFLIPWWYKIFFLCCSCSGKSGSCCFCFNAQFVILIAFSKRGSLC